MKSTMTTLKNGLRVITATRPETETVSLGIWINTGSAFESEAMNGISHFLEHMVFKGTENRNYLQISEEFEDVGGQSNAYTSREFTAFFAKMLKGDIELAIDILSDLIINPSFHAEELEKEKDVVIQEIKQTVDTPDDIIFDYLQQKAFPNQALGRNILGEEFNVRSFDKNTLQTYLKNNYAAENMIVCAVGNLEHNQFVKMVEQRMSEIQAKNSIVATPVEYVGGYYAEKRDIEQAHMVLGFNGVKYACEDYYPCMIFSTIFGGGMTSRLFQEIREKRGLVYTVYSFTNSHIQNGLFGIYAGTTQEELKQLMPVICDEIKKICTEKVDIKELNRAKIQLKASMLMTLESSSSTAEILARQMLLFNRIIPVEEMVERIERVTVDDIYNIANRIFSTNPTYALIGAIDGHPDYEAIKKMIKG